eukprot:jgi/Astpho2/7949/Aster-x1471
MQQEPSQRSSVLQPAGCGYGGEQRLLTAASRLKASQQRCTAMVFTMPVHNDGISLTREACRPRNIKVAASCPPSMQREGLWRVEDFELHKQLYKGKASLLYSATCKRTGIPIALKLYRKGRLSELNWHQASPNQGFWPLCL